MKEYCLIDVERAPVMSRKLGLAGFMCAITIAGRFYCDPSVPLRWNDDEEASTAVGCPLEEWKHLKELLEREGQIRCVDGSIVPTMDWIKPAVDS